MAYAVNRNDCEATSQEKPLDDEVVLVLDARADEVVIVQRR